jgi:hypothetical protein
MGNGAMGCVTVVVHRADAPLAAVLVAVRAYFSDKCQVGHFPLETLFALD